MTGAVDDWFDKHDSPLKPAMLRAREIILEDHRITETIKWQAPTFAYRGNMATFNPRSKRHVSLMFHTGATIPGDHPRLTGDNASARTMTFDDLDDLERHADALRAVVVAWCDSRPAE